MTQPTTQQAAVGPKYTHYVSLSNGCIYPAQTGSVGYEDLNPSDWRGASPDEKTRYLAGETAVDVSPIDLTAVPVQPVSAPTTLQLQPEDPVVVPPVVFAPAVQEAPIVPPVAPVVTPTAIAPAPLGAIPSAE